jgi:hypothetical protein
VKRIHITPGEKVTFTGDRAKRSFTVTITLAEVSKGKCASCGGPVLRSWRTGILHRHCFTCRYLRMIYGTSITVTRSAT